MEEKTASPPPQANCPEEEGFDDNDYAPDFTNEMLKRPPILPSEDRDKFEQLFEAVEFGATDRKINPGRPKSDMEYFFVGQATTILWELQRWGDIKLKIIASQGRPAAEVVFRRALDVMAPNERVKDVRAAVCDWANRYFSDHEVRALYDAKLEAAGYGTGAVEAEVFLRSLAALATIDKAIAGLERRLFTLMKYLDAAYSSRAPEEEMPPSPAAKRASGG